MMYRIVYRIVVLVLRYVSYPMKMYRCSPINNKFKVLKIRVQCRLYSDYFVDPGPLSPDPSLAGKRNYMYFSLPHVAISCTYSLYCK